MPEEQAQTNQPSEITPEPIAQPAPEQNPPFDKERLDSTLRFLDIKPEAKQYVLEKLSVNDERLNAVEKELAAERIMRKLNLSDDDRDLFDAPTIEAMWAKGEKLARRNAAIEEARRANEPQPEPEIVFQPPTETFKNPMDAAYARLERSKFKM